MSDNIAFLDARRLLCPMPVIRMQNMLKKMNKGQHLLITCSDRGTLHDIPSWCQINNYKLIKSEKVDSEYNFIVEA